MKIAFWSFYEENCVDMKMFHQADSVVAEGIFKKWNTLFQECKLRGISIVGLNTVKDFEEVDFFVFSDFPRLTNPMVQKVLQSDKPKILIIEEGPLIHPDNWKISNHKLFDYIFTWNDDYVDNIKYFKFNVHYIDNMEPITGPKDKLCVLIARNKRAWGKSELYSERRNIIRFFEKNHPDDFDLFGEGWDIFYFPSNVPILKLFNGSKMFWFRSTLNEKYPSWKGAIEQKKAILNNYKFSISLENSIGPTGYISEKIWDSFAAGTIPVYLGAPNVLDYIPANCFIDLRNFNGYEELYTYMSFMTEDVYNSYLENIYSFLNEQSKAGIFSDQYFVKKFVELVDGKKQLRASNLESE
jgi:hypothetical protein